MKWNFFRRKNDLLYQFGMSPGVLSDLMRRIEQVYIESKYINNI